MKKLILISLLLIAQNAISGTCTSISRTNNAANTVLTSTKYNLDHNTAYNAINAYDAGCISDGTLEDGALNTTDFAVPLNSLKNGCTVTKSDSNTVSIDKCMLAVNGAWVKTTGAVTATWGCSGCSAEATGTTYYVYALTGSTGSTLTAALKTGAPNGDGYNSAGDRVLARVYNDYNNDLDAQVSQWIGAGFEKNRICYAKEARNQNTSGGTFTSGAWYIRQLNTISTTGTTSSASCPFATIAGHRVTIDAGKYEIWGAAPANGVTGNMLRLYNNTAGSQVLTGTAGYSDNQTNVQSFVTGVINPTASTQYQLEHKCNASQATTGYGNASNQASETYAQIIIREI